MNRNQLSANVKQLPGIFAFYRKRPWLSGFFLIFLTACGVYSMNEPKNLGDAKTVSVQRFENRATQVNPQLSQEFTEAVKDKFLRETRLSVVTANGDLD